MEQKSHLTSDSNHQITVNIEEKIQYAKPDYERCFNNNDLIPSTHRLQRKNKEQWVREG